MAFNRKSIIAQSLIALFVGQMLITHTPEVQAAYKSGMNPGMQIRLEQQTLNSMKRSMQAFLPKYVNQDLELPTEYHYEFGMFLDFLNWKVDWTNITYQNAKLDIADVKINLTRGYDLSLIAVDFPAIKKWEIDADQEVNSWILPSKSKVELIFEDFDIDFSTDLVLDENGYLDPVVYDCDIKFGTSYLYHDNKIVAFVMHQFVYFAIVIVENSVYFVGDYIFSNMMGPIMDKALNHYHTGIILMSPFQGQHTKATFDFDFRNTQSPFIGEGYMDSYILGELTYKPSGELTKTDHGYAAGNCTLEPDVMSFMNSDTFSQLVITESAFSCMMNSFSQSPIGQIHLDNHTANQFFGTEGIHFNSSWIAPQIPLFEEKLGANQSLSLKLHMKDVKVLLGQFDTDMIFEYTLCMSWFGIGSGHKHTELMYDELKMISSMDMTSEHDIMYIKLLNHKLDIDSKFGQRSQPIMNNMDLTENEYREFLSTYGFTMNYLKKWLNDVYLRDGIFFPYNVSEFQTKVSFKEKSMHIMLEVEDNAEEFFEENYW